MINNLYDYREAGFRFFGIHGVDRKGRCECGDPECKAVLKHPRISRWQSVPDWSDEQLETWETLGWFRTGFGVLCSGWLVIDVDARNGGVESFKRLCEAIPEAGRAAFVVNTGSGGGSAHHYFRLPEPLALVQHLDSYPGLDFKSSGYVVGAGSLHASGARYETERGYPQDITDAPAALVGLLRKPERFRVRTDSGEIDVDEARIVELLGFVSPDCHYDRWIRVGMAIHHAMGGAGLEVWDQWSAGAGGRYPGSEVLVRHWHSFGKSGSPVGFGTLLHYAREGGYCEPVEFVYQGDQGGAEGAPVVDLKRPPGWVGELTAWINSQCLYPRETLAVAAALCAVSTLAGMRHHDTMDDIAPNLIAFCVAGSGTGKEAVQQAYLQILRTAGVQAALHGGFKSEQELMRNLIRHQLAAYSIDEIGLVLRKLANASSRGGAAYLEGLIGLVMSVYSKATGYLPVTGDLKEEIKAALIAEAARVEKRADNLPADSSADAERARLAERLEGIRADLGRVDDGLDSPYLTILGYTTPVTFEELMGAEQATNGFLARAILFQELETNPKRRAKFRKAPMPDGLASAIQNLYAPGRYDMMRAREERIQHAGERTPVATTPEAQEALDAAYERFHGMGEEQKEATGLEAIPRRGYEMTAKVSMLLAIPSGVRTLEHVVWAEALARRDCDAKIRMAVGTERKGKADGIAARILALVDSEHGETEGVIVNRLRGEPRESVISLLAQMEARGMLRSEAVTKGRGAGKSRRYFAVAPL